MALPSVWGVLRAQRQRWWSAAALKQALSENPFGGHFGGHFDGHFFQGLVISKEAFGQSLSSSGLQRRAFQTSAVLEARVKAASKEFWNPLLTSEGQETLEEELSRLRSLWQESAEGNAVLSEQKSESEGGSRKKSSKGRADETPPEGSKVHLTSNRITRRPGYADSAAQNDSQHSKQNSERFQSGGISDLDRGLPLRKTWLFGVQPPSSRHESELDTAAFPKEEKRVPLARASQRSADGQVKGQRGHLRSQASGAAPKKQAINQKEQEKLWEVILGRPRFGKQEAGEKNFDGHFAVRQGTAVTGSQWLEVAPDSEEAWESPSRRNRVTEGSRPAATLDSSRSKPIEAESEEKGPQPTQILDGAQLIEQDAMRREELEQPVGSADSLKEAGGALSAPERSDESNGAGSSSSVSQVADGAETSTFVHQEEQELLDEDAKSRFGSHIQRVSSEQHLDESLPVPSNQHDHVTSRNSQKSAEKLEPLDRQPKSFSNLSAEIRSSSQHPLREGPAKSPSLYVNEPSNISEADGESEVDTVPDLEELRTWLTQLDRREEQEEEDVATVASVPVGQQKSLRLAIMGPPNAGKSVLTNALVGSKVSAVSAKTNTTRAAILGVSTHRSTQLVICDTPGLAGLAPGKALRSTNKQLVNRAQRAGADCDAIIVVIDAAREIERPDPRIPRMIASLSEQLPEGQRHVLVLNKADAVRRQDRPKLEALRERFQELHAFDRCFVTSGKRELGLKQLQRYLRQNAALRPWELPEDRPTDLTDEQRAMDIVRQHLLDRLHKEVPYKIVVKPVSWETREDGLLEIRQDLVVDRKKLKAMVVGKQGATIKQITLGAREELGQILSRRIELFLNVRVEGT